MKYRSRTPASLAAVIAMLWAAAGHAQEEPSGAWIDGVFVEGYVYEPQFMEPQKLRTLISENSKDIVIVDTAQALIYEEERIPGAVNLPYSPTLTLSTSPVTLPRNKTLVIYCACPGEEESIEVAQKLSQFGYQNVKVLKGGWFEWLDLGYETEGAAVEGSSS